MTPKPPFPSLEVLTDGLTSVLSGDSATRAVVTVMERRPLNTTQSHPSEVVRCRMRDGQDLTVLCKYSGGAPEEHQSHGHRRGVVYEAMVYERLLTPAAAQVPPWLGTYHDQHQRTWLVIGFLDGGVRVSRVERAQLRATLGMAARWIAQFHNAMDAGCDAGARAALITYDTDYYVGWARRTLDFAVPFEHSVPWLAAVVDGYITSIVPMLVANPTVIHGEFYPGNILFWRGGVYALDWESAAVGLGEIDLACLLEGWTAATASEVANAYLSERVRPAGAFEFSAALDAARLYLQFRWLGDQRDWNIDCDPQKRFAPLREAAGRLGIL